jgi:hypothetical protein
MHYRPAGEGPIPRRPDFAQLVEEFPGPVVIAVTPPAGAIPLCGGEDSDGHPWALQVTYAASGRDLLRVRTVRGALDWEPVIRTIENLATNMGVSGRSSESAARAPETPAIMMVDGEPVAGTRIDLPGRSGVHLEWTGQHIYCTGDPDLIGGLELRTATAADFARYTAEFEEYIAQRRAQG